MTASAPPSAPSPERSAARARPSASEIDASCRWPLLLLFAHAALWLVLGTAVSVIVAIKFHAAGLLAQSPWLTVGRLQPAAINCFLFGFASQASMAVALWLLCRLGRVKLAFTWPLLVAGKLWNLGVLIGIWGILAGASTGFAWLEMPRYGAGVLFVAYALYGVCAVATFAARSERELFPSQWFLLAALFWFPWIYSAAQYLLVLDPVRGTLQAAVAAWYGGNFLHVWLTPVALAVVYYFIPHLTGQALHSRELAALAFWTLLVFGSLAGLAELNGGPVPRWLPSVGIAATGCLLAPLLANALNWQRTLPSLGDERCREATLRFVLFGAGCYLFHGLVSLFFVVPQVHAVTSLTLANVGRSNLALHGFVAMVLLGAFYHIVARLVGSPWPRERWIGYHFLCSALGVTILFLSFTLGGVVQGVKLADAKVPFLAILHGTIPFIGLGTLGMLILLVGQLFFLGNLALLLGAFLRPICQCLAAGCCPGLIGAKAGGTHE